MEIETSPTNLSQAIKPIMDEVQATMRQFPSQFGLSQNVGACVTIEFRPELNGSYRASLQSFGVDVVRAKKQDYDSEELEAKRASEKRL